MVIQGVLQPGDGRSLPSDAANWKIGIVQVLLASSCKMYFGKSRGSPVSEYYQEDYFSQEGQKDPQTLESDLPLIDKIMDDKQDQHQTEQKCDPAYSTWATSFAKLEDVFENRNVYFQLSMQDQPTVEDLDIEISSPNLYLYLNRVEQRCKFRTMFAVYKPGFSSTDFFPLTAVDWQFNVAATRDPNTENFSLSALPLNSIADLTTYSLGTVPFDLIRSSFTKTICTKMNPSTRNCEEKIFETPISVHKWCEKLVPLQSSPEPQSSPELYFGNEVFV
jgi:hypothetical protein